MRIDAVTFGEVMTMFVAAEPGPLERVTTFTRALAGAETNVATGLSRLGHPTGWIGRVGDDPFGRYALTELAAAGIDVSTVTVDADAPTGFQLKSFAGGGDPEVVYFRKNSAGSRLAPSAVLDSYVAGARHLHLTGIPLALSATTRAFAFRAVEVARAAGLTISFDPNLRPGLWPSTDEMVAVTNEMASLADWVLPGLGEGALLTGRADAAGIAAFYLSQGASRVVIKDGAAGCSMFTAAGRTDQPVFAVRVIDTVGAGDGFAAGLISAHLDGLSEAAALERAAAIGALAITSAGDKDGLPDRAELEAFLSQATPLLPAGAGAGLGGGL
jgi:2-dehydro-3-deoxygluconokinase